MTIEEMAIEELCKEAQVSFFVSVFFTNLENY